ncbi:MAG: hypothetical protein HY809_08105 [Nitrospirae bacterium]|nr:hypothetical protein [Nitrospirota bacterium]
MLVERQLSIFCAGISTAIAIPEFYPTIIKHAPVTEGPHVALLIGTSLGAFGAFLGILLAVEDYSYAGGRGWRLFCMSRMLAWIIFALCLSAGTAFIALKSSYIIWWMLLGVASLSPLISLIAAFVYRKR